MPDIHLEGPDSPKICLEIGNGGLAAGRLDEAGMRRVKQLGVNYVITSGPKLPWNESQLRSIMDSLKKGRTHPREPDDGWLSKHALREAGPRRRN